MITINDLSFSYNEKQVLQNINISFASPAIHGIVGLNGAGKTTFFNILCGFQKNTKGTILYNEQPIKKVDFAFLETENYFYPKLSGLEFLNVFPLVNHSFRQKELADLLNIPLDELIENYSTGMKKKLILLSHLKQDKGIYVLDEPFNGLDLDANKTFEILIATLRQRGKTVFISSHILSPLLTLCDQIHHLSNHTFVKTYDKNQFQVIEQEIFGDRTTYLKEKISTTI
ncbi:MAG: ATP-binding cassette domain-containing protein [Bacteroidetes bacterium]|nr:ATP-binding cassette domain-containing protein [Bacteroidota bacterium]